MKRSWAVPILAVFAVLAITGGAYAQSDSVRQPYLRELQEELGRHGDFTEQNSYSGEIKKSLPSESQNTDGTAYVDELREAYGEPSQKAPSNRLEMERDRLRQIPPRESVLQAVREGRGELGWPRIPPIHHLVGVSYGDRSLMDREVTAEADFQAVPFDEVYGGNYASHVSVSYEYQPIHSEWFGNLGLVGIVGFNYFHGKGRFLADIPIAATGQNFEPVSNVDFRFLTFTITVGLNYRFNLLRVIRPFIMVGPTGTAFIEARGDGRRTRYAFSSSLRFSAGAALLLDVFSSGNAWDMYSNYGIKHTYLTLEYTRLTPLSGSIRLNTNGFTAGIAFEY